MESVGKVGLREAVAKRLADIHAQDKLDGDNETFLLFLELADECIRQMEWARHRTVGRLNPLLDRLDAAPDDWSPPTIEYTPTPDPNDDEKYRLREGSE